MGLLRKVAGQFLPDVVDDYVHSPYDGEDYPRGTLGAVAIPGELEVELPPGKVKAIYRVWGTPRLWDSQKDKSDKNWLAPKFELSVMPLDMSKTPRLTMLEEDWKKGGFNEVVKALGWSTMKLYTFEVPEPGGTYKATITGALTDDQANVVLKKD